jgi:hypothetical protein
MAMSRRTNDASIETVREPCRTRVAVEGEMDLACVTALNRAMSEASSRDVPVNLDLSGVTFVDSRVTAAVGGWEPALGPARLTLQLPPDARLQLVPAGRAAPRIRRAPARRGGEELDADRCADAPPTRP